MEKPTTINPFLSEKLQSTTGLSKQHGHSWEYLEGAAKYLYEWLGITVTDTENLIYIKMLSQFPKWKLQMIDQYHPEWGKNPESVAKFLKQLEAPPRDPYSELGYDKERKQLPDNSTRAQRERQCGTELWKGLKKIMKDENIVKKKEAISSLHGKLRTKYPEFEGLLRGRAL